MPAGKVDTKRWGWGWPRFVHARWHFAVKLNAQPVATFWLLLAVCFGCNVCPTKWERERVHNPFPQLKRVAVLPFFNQSGEPTLDTALVSEKYYAALQAVPGFEVLPVGVTKLQWLQYASQNDEPVTGAHFQELARQMGVEALVVGSVTDFDPYYPPRMAMTVHWYAANEGFHPIPPGYGMPWGTEHEDEIPARIVREAEFELARSQLSTQTPSPTTSPHTDPIGLSQAAAIADTASAAAPGSIAAAPGSTEIPIPDPGHTMGPVSGNTPSLLDGPTWENPLPHNWPDPTDLIPDPPSPIRPPAIVSHEPVLSHTRIYRGDDPDFTIRLAQYVETGDDARPGNWQGYLKRSEDFIHFCCHLHIMEMLESRGGRDQSDLILRWPLSRY